MHLLFIDTYANTFNSTTVINTTDNGLEIFSETNIHSDIIVINSTFSNSFNGIGLRIYSNNIGIYIRSRFTNIAIKNSTITNNNGSGLFVQSLHDFELKLSQVKTIYSPIMTTDWYYGVNRRTVYDISATLNFIKNSATRAGDILYLCMMSPEPILVEFRNKTRLHHMHVTLHVLSEQLFDL